jgi:hypothetical protein
MRVYVRLKEAVVTKYQISKPTQNGKPTTPAQLSRTWQLFPNSLRQGLIFGILQTAFCNTFYEQIMPRQSFFFIKLMP